MMATVLATDLSLCVYNVDGSFHAKSTNLLKILAGHPLRFG